MFKVTVPLAAAGTMKTKASEQVAPEVAPEVMRLLSLCATPRTRRQMQAALQLKDDDHVRVAYVLPALNAGLIEMTIPDKPTSRLQKYRLTDKGRAALRQAKMEGGGTTAKTLRAPRRN